jgi:hypothetical protein
MFKKTLLLCAATFVLNAGISFGMQKIEATAKSLDHKIEVIKKRHEKVMKSTAAPAIKANDEKAVKEEIVKIEKAIKLLLGDVAKAEEKAKPADKKTLSGVKEMAKKYEEMLEKIKTEGGQHHEFAKK